MNRPLSSSIVRGWMERVSHNGVHLGPSPEESLSVAWRVWKELLAFPSSETLLRSGSDLPDVLHALVFALNDSYEIDSAESRQAVAALYQFVVDRPALLPDEDESRTLAANFAYIAWNAQRRAGRCREMRKWEEACEAQVMLQESTRDFLSLPLNGQPERLRERFLLDGATMLAFCRQLALRRNREPVRAEADARLAYHWVSEQSALYHYEIRSYFAGQLALCAATACKHLGRFHAAEGWVNLAARSFRETCHAEVAFARLEFLSTVLLFDRHLPTRVLEKISPVMASLRRLELDEEYHRCRFLEASALKSVGRFAECLNLLIEMSQEAEVQRDPMLHGSVLINIAEIQARSGELDESLRLFVEALPVLNQAELPWGLADRFAMMGQVFRDNGRLDEAINLYRSAISILDHMQMDGRAAYLRVVVAETLIASARQREAIDEIVVALPLLDREELIPPAIAAIALLRESIRREHADPNVLRELREQLEGTK